MQVEYKTKKGTMLFVKVPDDATEFYISGFDKQYLIYKTKESCKVVGHNQTILFRGFNIIGPTSEVTEEQAKIMAIEFYGIGYLHRFKSLMQHLQVYEINPYKQKPCDGCDDYEVFTEAQYRVGKWIVLFKPN